MLISKLLLIPSLLLSSSQRLLVTSTINTCHRKMDPSTGSSSSSCNVKSNDFIIGYVTINNLDKAKDLARKLVTNKKVACVNIIPMVTSIYKWENKLEEDEEVLMILKTRLNVVDDDNLIKFIKDNHPYDVPEVIFTPIVAGNVNYLDWINKSVDVDSSN